MWLSERHEGPSDKARSALLWSSGLNGRELFLQRLCKFVSVEENAGQGSMPLRYVRFQAQRLPGLLFQGSLQQVGVWDKCALGPWVLER